MRKLEAVAKEIVDEMGYLQRREMRMRDTNGAQEQSLQPNLCRCHVLSSRGSYQVREYQQPGQELCLDDYGWDNSPGSMASKF